MRSNETQSNETRSVDEVMARLERAVYHYDAAAIDAAVALKHRIMPRLRSRLEEVLANPEAAAMEDAGAGHVYALILLAHFRDDSVHSLILDLFRLPAPLLEPIFGRLVDENGAGFLFATCGGDPTRIQRLVEDESAAPVSRAAGVGALVLAVAAGVAHRGETIAALMELLSAAKPGVTPTLTGALGSALIDLYPDVSRHLLLETAEKHDDWLICGPFFDLTLACGPEAAMNHVRARLAQQVPLDVHAWLFQPDWVATELPDIPGLPTPGSGRPRSHRARRRTRRRRAMTRLSRRRNRHNGTKR